jgi:outer membrane protein OmpA-like peptidoglycan-associated protein
MVNELGPINPKGMPVMLTRVCAVSLVAFGLTACAGGVAKQPYSATTNMPGSPANMAETKAEIDAMRVRLERERNRAYMLAQGITPPEEITLTPPPARKKSDAASADNTAQPVTFAPPVETQLPPVEYQYPLNSGTVEYNTTANKGPNYVYGYSPVHIATIRGANQSLSAAETIHAANPSISIDMGALDGASGPHDGMGMGGMIMDIPGERALSASALSGMPLVRFRHGSATLSASDRAAIAALAADLKKSPRPFVIAGHASARTGLDNPMVSRDINLKMSAKRADAVMHELAKYGVRPEQIFIAAYGDAVPAKNDGSLPQEAADRRVEIIFNK